MLVCCRRFGTAFGSHLLGSRHPVPLLTFVGPCIVIYFYSKTNQMHQCIKFILFWNDTVHVSDGLSIHHQQFNTVHTATKQILLSAVLAGTSSISYPLASSQQYLFGCCVYSVELLMMDGKTVRNMYSAIPKIK